ncbi:MAG TPA: hypothetical protein VM287_05305 [Egibacteraceae bacterium]|nr:hypothetical protein [Egibacteraceae bacterium]
MTADIWAFCDTCERWFFCADWFDKEAPQPCCPVCRAEPSAIENRAAMDNSVPAGGA